LAQLKSRIITRFTASWLENGQLRRRDRLDPAGRHRRCPPATSLDLISTSPIRRACSAALREKK